MSYEIYRSLNPVKMIFVFQETDLQRGEARVHRGR